MTQEELERFTNVMYAKVRGLHWDGEADEVERAKIQMVIADTSLLLDGSVTLERWEDAVAEATR